MPDVIFSLLKIHTTHSKVLRLVNAQTEHFAVFLHFCLPFP